MSEKQNKIKYFILAVACYLVFISTIFFADNLLHNTEKTDSQLNRNINVDFNPEIKLPVSLRPLLLETNGRNVEKFYIRENPDGTYDAVSGRQKVKATFDRNGIIINPASRFNSPWSLGLNFSKIGYENNLSPVAPPKIYTSANSIKYSREDVSEWYVNRPIGLEQGFTIYNPPTGQKSQNSSLKIEIEFTSELKPVLNEYKNEITWKNDKGSEVFKYNKLLAYDSNSKILPSYLTVSGNKYSIHVDDNEAVYPIVIDPILIQETLIHAPSDPDILAKYGQSVAIDGNVAVVGSPGDNDNGDLSGSAYIHIKDQGGPNNWGEFLKITPVGASPCELFGYSVDVSGDIIAVGANTITTTSTCPSDAGVVYIFSKDAGGVDNWGEVTKITASDGAVDDLLGYDVSVNGDTVVAGAPAHYAGGIFVSGAA